MSNKAQYQIWMKLFIIFILGLSLAVVLLPFWLSLVFGGILTIAISPLYEKILMKVKIPKKASLYTLLVFGAIILVPTIVVGVRSAKITTDFLTSVNQNKQILPQSDSFIHDWTQQLSVLVGMELPKPEELVQKALVTSGDFVLKVLSQFLSALPDFLISLIIAMLVMYFALINQKFILNFLIRLSLLDLSKAKVMFAGIRDSCRQIFVANLITGGVQAFIIASTSAILGAADFFVVGFLTFLFSFIPVIGAAPVGIFISIIQFFEGNYISAGILLALSLIAGTVDNIIRPMLLSGKENGSHPLINLLSILGGVFLFGLPGLFLGPLIVSVAFVAIPIYYDDLEL
jgi:predicted PurR-regulated permease PerM